MNTETLKRKEKKVLGLSVIRFNKCWIKSPVRASEQRPPSQANAVTTLAWQSLTVCKYCNKQQGFPHKRCSSSTATDRRYGPRLQDKERCLPLSSPLFCCLSKEIVNLRCRQGHARLEVSVRAPKLTWLFTLSLPLSPLNPCPREPFRWIDFLLRCNIHYGLQYIMLSPGWTCRYSVTFPEYVCC